MLDGKFMIVLLNFKIGEKCLNVPDRNREAASNSSSPSFPSALLCV